MRDGPISHFFTRQVAEKTITFRNGKGQQAVFPDDGRGINVNQNVVTLFPDDRTQTAPDRLDNKGTVNLGIR